MTLEFSTEDDTSLQAPSDHRAREWITALAAAGVDCGLSHVCGRWVLHFKREQADQVRAAIAAYEADNCDWPPPQPPVIEPPADTATRSWSPIWVAGFLTAFYLLSGPYAADNPTLRAAVADATAIRAGEVWRLVTALTLHADETHLLGNVVTLILLGFSLCRRCGSGIAWTAVLLAGAGGNALAALLALGLRGQDISLGASTAGFGALGLLCGLRLADITQTGRQGLPGKRDIWRILGAGIAMLALLGTGPNSDLAGHAGGFLCGVLLGLPLTRITVKPLPILAHRLLELACLSTVMLCWRAALNHA